MSNKTKEWSLNEITQLTSSTAGNLDLNWYVYYLFLIRAQSATQKYLRLIQIACLIFGLNMILMIQFAREPFKLGFLVVLISCLFFIHAMFSLVKTYYKSRKDFNILSMKLYSIISKAMYSVADRQTGVYIAEARKRLEERSYLVQVEYLDNRLIKYLSKKSKS